MSDNDIHVMPINDLRKHVFENCPCHPKIEVVGASLIYIHNSWDHREAIEQIEEMFAVKGDE